MSKFVHLCWHLICSTTEMIVHANGSIVWIEKSMRWQDINKKELFVINPEGLNCKEFSSLLSGAYGTRTRDPMRDRHVF